MSDYFLMKDLLESGVHFGHQVRRWNPKMKKYIYTKRNGIHIIDLQKTVRMANQVYKQVREFAQQGKKILFVCTKQQGSQVVKEAAIRCGMPYITKRWLGGFLTNMKSIRNSVNKYYRIQRKEADGTLQKLGKKEQNVLLKQKKKIEETLGGVLEMDSLPDYLFVIDSVREHIALLEAKKLGIPVIGLIDTNSDPDYVDYPIPANDDAIRALKLFAMKIADAINEGVAMMKGETLDMIHEKVESEDLGEGEQSFEALEEAVLNDSEDADSQVQE